MYPIEDLINGKYHIGHLINATNNDGSAQSLMLRRRMYQQAVEGNLTVRLWERKDLSSLQLKMIGEAVQELMNTPVRGSKTAEVAMRIVLSELGINCWHPRGMRTDITRYDLPRWERHASFECRSCKTSVVEQETHYERCELCKGSGIFYQIIPPHPYPLAPLTKAAFLDFNPPKTQQIHCPHCYGLGAKYKHP